MSSGPPNFSFVLVFLTLSVVTFLPTASSAASFEQQLDFAVERFNAQKSSARNLVLREYDRLLRSVPKRKELEPDVQVAYLEELKNAKATFEETGQFTNQYDCLPIEISYFVALSEPFNKIEATFDNEIKRAIRMGDSARAANLVKQRDELADELLGLRPLAAIPQLKGTLHRSNGKSIPYHLRIADVNPGGIFQGTVDDNPGVAGHWRYRVAGQVKGPRISFKMTTNLRGKITGFHAEGILVGDRLVATVKQQIEKKPIETMFLVLEI